MSDPIRGLPAKTADGRPIFQVKCDEHCPAVGIAPYADGVEIFLEGHEDAVALVDLFYMDPKVTDDPDRRLVPQLVIFDPRTEDAVAFIRLKKRRTEIHFERGVQVLGQDAVGDPYYGYPEEE